MRALSSKNTLSKIVLRNQIDKIRLLFHRDRESYLCFYRILGFYPRNIQLYEQALLHKSSSVRSDKGRPLNNERLERLKKGKPYSIVVVAEGIQTDGRKRAAEYIAQEIEYETGIETRETVLGYIQRGGSPTPYDRNLSTRMGGHATELIANGEFGRMVALKGDTIASIPLEEVAGKLKLVSEDHDLVIQGRRMGICFG